MGFIHNKQHFADENSYQFAYKHPRQLDCGGQSFAEFSSTHGVPGIYPNSEREMVDIISQFRGKERCGGDDNVLTDTAPIEVADYSSSLWFTSNSSELHGKRPLSEDKSDNLAFKRARQVDQNGRMDSPVELSSFSRTSDGSSNSVVDADKLDLENRTSAAGDPAKNVPSSNLSLPWVTSPSVQEDTRSESPVRLSFFPGYFEDACRATGFIQPQEAYPPVFDHRPRKHVPIGSNHQADIPVCIEKSDYSSSSLTSVTYSATAGYLLIEEDDSDKWMGTIVLPMPNSNSYALEIRCGENKPGCSCPDEGSIRCVRQHVMEVRENLKKTLGPEKFVELGFYDMGEVVAQKWTEKDEQLFHEVVASNPASLGKNFWDGLPVAFPSRSIRELVSYYFNVFMLRKRAEQNRADPLAVDSDDDEWQESVNGVFGMTEENDEDSVVESPADSDDVARENVSQEEAAHLHDDTEDEDDYCHCAVAGHANEELYAVSEGCITDKSKFTHKMQPLNNSSREGVEEQCVQDESCTSFEGQPDEVRSCSGRAGFVETPDCLLEQEYRNDGMSSMTDHEYLGRIHCDPKVWEISYTEKDLDFLPTCNVIEQFGNDSWEN